MDEKLGSNTQLDSNIDKKIGKFLEIPLISLSIIVMVAFAIRINYVDFEIPIALDSLEYFVYAIDASRLGYLPETYSPSNNGWSIFLAGIFNLFEFDNALSYMQLQKIFSILISSLIPIAVYFLGRQFFGKKYAILGSIFFAFDPRIILNSTIGIGDQLFILLMTISLVVIIKNNKFVYFSFALTSIATMIRPEGIFLFAAILIMFFIKNKKKYRVIPKIILAVIIFFIVLFPIMTYKTDVLGDDRIFGRASETIDYHLQPSEVTNGKSGIKFILNGIENFPKYLGWTMIPNFILFVPFGAIILFREWKKTNLMIIIPIISLAIPSFYVYSIPLLETRYIYFLFPLFCIISLFSIKKIVSNRKYENIILMIIIGSIITAGLLFLDYKKIDYDSEKDSIGISKFIFYNANGVNSYQHGKFLKSVEVIERWPTLPQMYIDGHIMAEVPKIPRDQTKSIEEYIIESKDKGLTHLVVSSDNTEDVYFQDLIHNEEKYTFLEKKYEEINEKNTIVKIFEINYNKLKIKR